MAEKKGINWSRVKSRAWQGTKYGAVTGGVVALGYSGYKAYVQHATDKALDAAEACAAGVSGNVISAGSILTEAASKAV